MAWYERLRPASDRFVLSAGGIARDHREGWVAAEQPVQVFDDALRGARETVTHLYESIDEFCRNGDTPPPAQAGPALRAFLTDSRGKTGARYALIAAFGTLLADVVLAEMHGDQQRSVSKSVGEVLCETSDPKERAIAQAALAIPSAPQNESRRFSENVQTIVGAGGGVPLEFNGDTATWIGFMCAPSIKYGQAIMLGLSPEEAARKATVEPGAILDPFWAEIENIDPKGQP